MVRSAAVPPATASKSLVARLAHSNPNVQLLALQLADVLVKNAGNQFIQAFSSSSSSTGGGAVTQLEHLVDPKPSAPASAAVNRDVQLAARKLLQDWATAFTASQRPALAESDLVRLYSRLVARGSVPFPEKATASVTAAMVDSLSAPDWSDSPYCTRCRTEFSTFNRKHHCRNCGQVFDQQCSSQSLPLPHFGISEPVRVCDACAKKIKDGKGASVVRDALQKAAAATTTTTATSATARTTSSSRRQEQEDADLQRAIQASLAESTQLAAHGPARTDANIGGPAPPSATTTATASGYAPSYAAQVQSRGGDSKSSTRRRQDGDEDDDPELAAAIAASLKDLEANKKAPPPTTYADMFPASAPAPRIIKSTFHLPSYDLSPAEQSHLDSFIHSQLSAPPSPLYPSAASRDPRAYLYVRDEVQPKLERNVEDARRRGEILREMEAKLSEAARLYGAGLTERVGHYHHQPQTQGAFSDGPQTRGSLPHCILILSCPGFASAPAYRPSAPRAASSYTSQPYYAPPAALASQTDAHRYAAPAPVGLGQPLPAYAVPFVPVPAPDPASVVSSPPLPLHQHQRQQRQQQHHATPVPVPAGYYKPSQFPNVPRGSEDPLALATAAGALPEVPRENPWQQQQQREEEEEAAEEEEERGKVGELIEL